MSAPVTNSVIDIDLEILPRLRIAVFNRIFSPTGGGAERYAIALVEQLAARHEIHVYAQQIDHEWPGVTYHRVSMPLRKPRWLNQLWFATATWWATRRGFDIVHSHENTWHGDVQTVHVLPVAHNLFVGRTGQRRALRWLKVVTSPRLLTYLGLEHARFAPRAGRQVVVTSDTLLTTMADTFPKVARAMSVVTPGITLPAVTTPADKGAARRLLGLPRGPCLLFVGNDYRKKGLATVLDALLGLPANVSLAVVGNPAQIPIFEDVVKQRGLVGRVFFLGALKDVSPAYVAADLLVHATLEDTFAMVVLEAMSHGLPVVVSGPAWCGISALLADGVNALVLRDPEDVVEVEDAIRRVLDEPDFRRFVAKGAAHFARAYQWPAIARRQEAIYLASVNARQGGDGD